MPLEANSSVRSGPEIKSSVIIPTRNPGVKFSDVLDSVLNQETPWTYEVVIIDSESSDGTVQLLEKYKSKFSNVNWVQIQASDFGHGRTRNLGGRISKGEFLVYLTQDALPVNSNWLYQMVSTCDASPEIAGAFGRHRAYPSASRLTQIEIDDHFNFLSQLKYPMKLENPTRYLLDLNYRQNVHFFSNNNSCLRRSVWEKIPFGDVNFAEDQLWAKGVIEAGYSKAYANESVVYHSHDYSLWKGLQRRFDESLFFYELFGYQAVISLRDYVWMVWKGAKHNTRRMLEKGDRTPLVPLAIGCLIRRGFLTAGLYLGSRVRKGSFLARRLSSDSSVKRLKTPSYVEFRIRRAWGNIKTAGGLRAYLAQRSLNRKTSYWHFGAENDPIEPWIKDSGTCSPKVTNFAFSDRADRSYNLKRKASRLDYKGDLTVAWVMPPFAKGGGGHYTVFRCQGYLKKLFNMNSVNFLYPSLSGPNTKKLERELQSNAYEWFSPGYCGSEFILDWKRLNEFPILLATAWNSAFPILENESALLKAYFIQDFEPSFYPEGASKSLAEMTYDFNYFPICAGPWLPQKIGFEAGGKREQPYVSFHLAADPSVFFVDRKYVGKKRSGVCFYVRAGTERRGFQLVLAAIEYLKSHRPDIPIYTLGMPASHLNFVTGCTHYGICDVSSLRKIYSQHSAYVAPSFTNYSLLPAEVIATGGRLIDLDRENNRAVKNLFPESSYFLAAADSVQLAQKIIEVCDLPVDPVIRAPMPDWETEFAKVGRAILGEFGRQGLGEHS
jgi:rhamnosyltransferase